MEDKKIKVGPPKAEIKPAERRIILNMPNTDPAQLGTQMGQMLGKATMEGVWMSLVMLWQLVAVAWPALILLAVLAVVSHRLR